MINVLNGILTTINAFFITLIGVKILDFVFNLVNYIVKTKKEEQIIQNLSNSNISIKDIHSLTPLEFESFSSIFLKFMGYEDIEHVPAIKYEGDGGKDLICFKNGIKHFVECKRYSYNSNAFFIIDLDVVRKLVGAMAGEGVTKGIIITTGHVSQGALDFAKNLPHPFSIDFFKGEDLLEMFKEDLVDDSAPAQV